MKYRKISLYLFLSLFTLIAKAQDQFSGQVLPLPKDVQTQTLNNAWHEGCPMPISELAYVTVKYWGFDNLEHDGAILINKKIADDTLSVFKALYDAKYHIQTVGLYNPDYAKNNVTVGFYCDDKHRNDGEAKIHALGMATDINPTTNPVVGKNKSWPENAANYVNRAQDLPGMVRLNHKTFNIFTAHGWMWGGLWQSRPNYMHFQKVIMKHYIVQSMVYEEQQ